MKDEALTIFVTGAAGFIGSNFVRFLRRRRPSWHIVSFDALTYAGNRANLAEFDDDPHHRFIHGDVRDRDAVSRALEGCRAVVHLAAESHVDRSIADAGAFVSTNVVGTHTLLEACRQATAMQRFVHVGTDEVYGSLPLDRPELQFDESSLLLPNSPYAASKAAGDLLALAYHATYGLPVTVTRSSNNYGPYQYPEKVIPLFVTNLLDGVKVPLYGDGLNVRDWLHVEDHCDALLRVLEDGRAGEIYNVGGSNELSNLDLTRAILDLMGCDAAMIEKVTDRPGHDRRYALDASKLANELGWAPSKGRWPDALAATIDWYRANEAWWRPLKG